MRSSSVTTSSSLLADESWSAGQVGYPWELRLHQRPLGRLLTDRQMEVIGLAAHGLTDKEIGERTGTTHQTVKNHLTASFRALGVQGRVEAFFVLGWLHPPSEVAA